MIFFPNFLASSKAMAEDQRKGRGDETPQKETRHDVGKSARYIKDLATSDTSFYF
jgi:hypothetical protein